MLRYTFDTKAEAERHIKHGGYGCYFHAMKKLADGKWLVEYLQREPYGV